MTEKSINNEDLEEAKCFLFDLKLCYFQKNPSDALLKQFSNDLLKNLREKIDIRKNVGCKYGDVKLPETNEIWYHANCYGKVTSIGERALQRKKAALEKNSQNKCSESSPNSEKFSPENSNGEANSFVDTSLTAASTSIESSMEELSTSLETSNDPCSSHSSNESTDHSMEIDQVPL